MQFIFPIFIMLNVFAIIIGVPVSIFFAFKASGEQDPILKKATEKKAWLSFLVPIILLFALVTFWGFTQVIVQSFF